MQTDADPWPFNASVGGVVEYLAVYQMKVSEIYGVLLVGNRLVGFGVVASWRVTRGNVAYLHVPGYRASEYMYDKLT